MSSSKREELAALAWARSLYPVSTIFRYLRPGERFKFAAADQSNPGQYTFTMRTFTVIGRGWYRTDDGQTLRTSPLAAVIPMN